MEKSSRNEQGHRIENKMTQVRQRKGKQSGNKMRLARAEMLHILIICSAVTRISTMPVL